MSLHYFQVAFLSRVPETFLSGFILCLYLLFQQRMLAVLHAVSLCGAFQRSWRTEFCGQAWPHPAAYPGVLRSVCLSAMGAPPAPRPMTTRLWCEVAASPVS